VGDVALREHVAGKEIFMIDNNTAKKKAFNPWHFIWIAVVVSELFTALMNTLQHYISPEMDLRYLLKVGAIDSLFVPLIVAPIVIYFLRSTSTLKKINARLEHEIDERKRAEIALLKEKNQLTTIIDSSPISIWFKDTKNKFIRINKAAGKIANRPVEEVEGHSADEIFPAESAKYYEDDLEVINSGKSKFGIIEPANADGINTWVRTDKVPWYDVDGRIAGIVAFALDITDRVVTEEALYKSEEKYRELIQEINDGLFITDDRGVFTFVNNAFARIYGYEKPDDLIGKNIIELTLPERREALMQEFNRNMLSGREVGVIDLPIERPDKSRAYIQVRPVNIIERDRIVGTRGIVQDITERKLAEEALREEKAFTENALNTLKDLFFVFDFAGKFLRWNNALNAVSGYSDSEITSMKTTDFFMGKDIDRISEAIQTAVQEGSASVEALLVTKDGRQIPYELAGALLRDHKGNPIAISGVGKDITERKRAEEEQAKLEAQLRHAQKMESIGTLAGGIAHDFNNVLTAIVGYGHIALMKMAKDDPQRVNIEHILEAGERAARLTQSLLLFSRKQISDRRPMDLNEVIRTVDKFLKRVIGEDVECRTSLFEEALPISGDAQQLEQVLMNLATNARDAMSKGGIFTIGTERVRLDDTFIAVHGFGKPGIYGLITISDTGMGIDAVTREHIFEPFFTTKEVGKGTGLGLAIAYGIIKQHEGYINVYSESGHGTSFKIYLPLISATMETENKPAEDRPRGGVEIILLAEDDETVRTMNKAILEEAGYTVIAAVDGQDAVNKYKENKDRIKLLLFDIIMPTKTGKEAYDEIRAIQPDIKILFQSGYAPDLVRQKVLLEDKMPVVFKPVTPMMLLKQVRSVLDHVK
jgi:PAS domain S-box-containing protein